MPPAAVDWVILLEQSAPDRFCLYWIFRTSLQPHCWFYFAADFVLGNATPFWNLVRDALTHVAFCPGVKPTAIYMTVTPWAVTPKFATYLLRSFDKWAKVRGIRHRGYLSWHSRTSIRSSCCMRRKS